MMDENNISPKEPDWEKLLDQLEGKQLTGNELSAQEKRELEALRKQVADAAEALQLFAQFDVNQNWNKLYDKITRHNSEASTAIPQKIKLWPKLMIAAAVVVVITSVAKLFFFAGENKQTAEEFYAADIKPGIQGATLTLADGKKFSLNNMKKGELAKDNGVRIHIAAPGRLMYNGSNSDPSKMNVLSTANGQTYQVALADGTMVYLNAGSSLSYPVSFSGKSNRMVQLAGEAYFEVAKDKLHPFIVTTDKQKVEVLGTHFNISSYPDESQVKTTLLEGSVKVSALRGSGSVMLKPNQQSTLNNGLLQVKEADIEEAMAWRNNYFRFNKENIQSIMVKLARWYDVDVNYQGEITKEKFTGTVSRNQNISEALLMLQQTKGVHFKIEGRRITVIK